jgi:hypothetical protein
MNKRPLAVLVIGWIFILAGVVGLTYHLTELNPQRPFENDAIWVLLVRLLAIIGGLFMLRGSDWARWLLVMWMAYHIILSAFHSMFELITHTVLLAVIAYFLFRPHVSAYFRAERASQANPNSKDDAPVAK